MSTTKTIIISTVLGAIAGACTALIIVKYSSPKIAVANVQEIVSASPKVQDLQAEQRAKIENLALFVKNANEEIGKVDSDKVKKELESKYMEELTAQKANFEKDYIQKLAEISTELSETINAKAAEIGYNVVLSKDAVVAGAKDITAELIEYVK